MDQGHEGLLHPELDSLLLQPCQNHDYLEQNEQQKRPPLHRDMVQQNGRHLHHQLRENVMVRGSDLIFSIVYLFPLSSDCPFMFTISIMFLPDVYQYTICIPRLSRSPLVTILLQPSMRFYGPCSSKDTINTASFCTMYFKLDLRSAVL